MKELIGHIESLLLSHDCVIVPDFGGFIAFNIPARWVEGKNTFVPPVRTVGFNPQLKLNDGLVVQAYMSAYGTNFPDASKRVHKASRELKHYLMNQGVIELQGLGTLRVAMDGSYHFVPFVDGLNSPVLYGLNELNFPLLVATSSDSFREIEPRKAQIKKIPLKTAEETTEVELEPRLRTSGTFWRVVGTTAAAVALFFSLSAPVGNINEPSYQRAQVVANELFKNPALPVSVKKAPILTLPSAEVFDSVSAPAKTDGELPVTFQENPLNNKEELEISPVRETVVRDLYFVVICAFSKENVAEETVAKLRNEGFSKACVISNSRMHKVCISSYSNEEEAVKALRKFRNGKYEDAWVYKNMKKS